MNTAAEADALAGSPGEAVADFIHGLTAADIPDDVLRAARRSLLDLLGVAAAGRGTANARIVCGHVARHCGAGDLGARVLFDGRRVSIPGAAMAGAAMIDSLDAHDGHSLTKGHAGVVVLPAALAIGDELAPATGAEFLLRLIVGYEVALRAGMALHATAADYHSSGAWNAVGAAAVAARGVRLPATATRHALGVAEYYAPRGPMMRCIDHPTMVKDGATYGAQVGVAAALLAADGFTGAPADLVDAGPAADLWCDLGRRWRMAELYLKAWPVCRWAQPAVEAAATIRSRVRADHIATVTVVSFAEAVRLAMAPPATTEEAQYALAFPVAAMLLDGRVDAATVTDGIVRRDLSDLTARIRAVEDQSYSALFPAERWAHLVVRLTDGTEVSSAPCQARGDLERPLGDAYVEAKFFGLAAPSIGEERSRAIADAVGRLPDGSPLPLDLVLVPVRP